MATVELECEFLTETDAAVQVQVHGYDEPVWFPLSQVASMHKGARGDGSIVVEEWIARKKGLL